MLKTKIVVVAYYAGGNNTHSSYFLELYIFSGYDSSRDCFQNISMKCPICISKNTTELFFTIFSHDILFKELNKKSMRKSLKRYQPRHTR